METSEPYGHSLIYFHMRAVADAVCNQTNRRKSIFSLAELIYLDLNLCDIIVM